MAPCAATHLSTRRYNESTFKAAATLGGLDLMSGTLGVDGAVKSQVVGTPGEEMPLISVYTAAQGKVGDESRCWGDITPCTVEVKRHPLNCLLCSDNMKGE